MAEIHEDHTMLRVRTIFVVLLVATLFLAVFQSNGLVSWSYDLPINPLTEQIVGICEGWNGWMETLGATAFSEFVQDWVLSLQDAEFTSET